ncbi:hypothetical protein [Thalassoglobus sp.]|uniref:hypothetical protein n=1 Tax=Thalassoglobus sp. TaxID=2795869 RepID=UPI003AA84245
MPRKPKVPSYCLHKASGQAVVRINGRDHYLGLYGTDSAFGLRRTASGSRIEVRTH